MANKRAHSFEEVESQQDKMDTTDEEVLEQKPDRDAIEKWASDVLVKLGKIHEDVRELLRDLAYVISQVEALESRKGVEEQLAGAGSERIQVRRVEVVVPEDARAPGMRSCRAHRAHR